MDGLALLLEAVEQRIASMAEPPGSHPVTDAAPSGVDLNVQAALYRLELLTCRTNLTLVAPTSPAPAVIPPFGTASVATLDSEGAGCLTSATSYQQPVTQRSTSEAPNLQPEPNLALDLLVSLSCLTVERLVELKQIEARPFQTGTARQLDVHLRGRTRGKRAREEQQKGTACAGVQDDSQLAKLHKAMLEGEGLVAALGEDDVDVKLPATVAGGAGSGQPHRHGKAEKPAATRTSARVQARRAVSGVELPSTTTNSKATCLGTTGTSTHSRRAVC